MNQDNRHTWVFGLNVYLATDEDVARVKENGGFSPLDQALIDSGFWGDDREESEKMCISYRVFEQGAKSAIENPLPFIDFYNELKENLKKESSGLIIPEQKKIIIPGQ